MNIKVLRQKRADLVAEAQSIFDVASAESRGLTEADANRDDAIAAELKDVDAQIERVERQMDRQRTLGAVTDGNDVAAAAPASKGKLFASLGEQLLAVMRAEPKVEGFVDPRLRQLNAATGMSEGVPSDGGFLVQSEYSNDLIRPMYENGQILQRVRRIPIGPGKNGLKMNAVNETSRANGSRWGGVQAYWTGEGQLKTPSAPTFRTMELNLKKLTGLCYATDELLEDAVALEDVIRQAFEDEFTFMVEDSIINGDGVGKPLGFLNAGGTISVSKETSQTAATIVAENIYNMWMRMPARSRANAVWLINQDAEASLNLMTVGGTAAVPVYMPAGGLSGAPFATLLGRPVIAVEYNATLGTAGDIMLVDLSQYLLIDKGGTQRDTSIHVRFIYDETVFRFVYRVDGQPMWNSAVTPKNGTNTISPFVTLATRA
jgi:HK97 family phage major capsid protein